MQHSINSFQFQVFQYRSFVNTQKRKRLDVITLPATSLQIHALRARGSVDAFTGNTKLISLVSAVKLAADGNFQIPRNVIEECRKYTKVCPLIDAQSVVSVVFTSLTA